LVRNCRGTGSGTGTGTGPAAEAPLRGPMPMERTTWDNFGVAQSYDTCGKCCFWTAAKNL